MVVSDTSETMTASRSSSCTTCPARSRTSTLYRHLEPSPSPCIEALSKQTGRPTAGWSNLGCSRSHGWAQGSRDTQISLAELHDWFAESEVIGWVDRSAVGLPKTSVVPNPPKTGTYRRARRPGLNTVGPFLPAPITVNDTAQMTVVTFFLLNGWASKDGLSTCHEGKDQRGGLDVALGDWELRIDPRGDLTSAEVHEHTQATGRHTVTHIGRLRRSDGAEFDGVAVQTFVETLNDLLSFSIGRVVSVVLPVGYFDGVAVWAHWGATRPVDLPLKAVSWLGVDRACTQLSELLVSGFLTNLDPLKSSAFKNALAFYLTANFDSLETMSTLLPVSGLQVIAYAHFVETLPAGDPAHISRSAWKDAGTQAILRRLTAIIGADLSAPPHLSRLTDFWAAEQLTAKQQGQTPPADPLGVVVKMRNSVAHPNGKSLGRWTHFDWTEAGFYAMHLFDLALLWWLGYEGGYSPRIDRRRLRSVPWAGHP